METDPMALGLELATVRARPADITTVAQFQTQFEFDPVRAIKRLGEVGAHVSVI